MKNSDSNGIKRGQAISFRVPSDTPDYLLKHLQKLKDSERRNFSSKIAEFVLKGVGETLSKERETITIPLPQKLSKTQRDWLKHEHSEALLGSIVYQLLNDPVRATALLASLNSNAIDINDALYLQEEVTNEEGSIMEETTHTQIDEYSYSIETETAVPDDQDDLDSFDWQTATQNRPIIVEEETANVEEDLDSLLGDFLNKMNK